MITVIRNNPYSKGSFPSDSSTRTSTGRRIPENPGNKIEEL